MADRHNRDINRSSAKLPEPLGVTCVDSHAHLELIDQGKSATDPSIGEVLALAKSVGIDRIVQVGYSAEQSEWGVKLAEHWPNVLAAVALHPCAGGGVRRHVDGHNCYNRNHFTRFDAERVGPSAPGRRVRHVDDYAIC